jgi:hypothetical protein
MSDEPADEVDAATRAGIEPEPGGTSAHDEFISAHEERLASERASAIAAGRRKGGAAGAAMAGAMLAVSDIIDGPPKEDAPVTVEASSDPHDLERDGVDVTVGEVGVSSPPLERVDPVVGSGKNRRRR